MSNRNHLRVLYDYLRIVFGTFVAACGIALFSNPAKLTGGGVTGIGTILYYSLGLDPGIVMMCINIPLFFIGMKVFGSVYGLRVFVGSTLLSLWVSFIGGLTHYQGFLDYSDSVNVLLSAVAYGVLVGGGIGIVMRAGSNCGGTDILAQIVAKHTPFAVGSIEFLMNISVVLTGTIFFGLRNTLMAFIAMYISGTMINLMVVKVGTSLAKTAFIFSNERCPDISRRVITELHHGGTLFRGTGIYTSKERNMLMVVVHNNQLITLEKIVHEEDPTAFMFINDAYQVLGNGFVPLNKVGDEKR
ncbi:YitT family protein [Bullifex porci]|uniref:YitT family protein n=2 Tax=Bullifex porci TaxID=2606638 RepID=A0A7X2PET4_9SPIO|nr:YitT family protein [Bullifex porci]MDD7255533.1 YitT family protein [Bullifex porci]MDD7589697.1 YitT family protein [Bullifex porci]MDY2740286.1 YitT family protein [Bullifex porci]MSU07030.1 YitT family protein [Bullifex porci]